MSGYSVILSALYLPLTFMLVGLIWSGVAFEFRFKSDEMRGDSSSTFALFSTLANESHALPFVLTMTLLFLGFTGLAITVSPNILPPAISTWHAA